MDNVTLARALIEAAVDPASADQVLGGDRLQPLARGSAAPSPSEKAGTR
jgi:hypothetical protein